MILSQLDLVGTIVEIAYIGKDPVEARNIGRLVGWHESFLNGAAFSFEGNMIRDWIEYFNEDWVSIIYHDFFTELIGNIRDGLQIDKGMFSILDKIYESAETSEEDGVVVGGRRKLLGDRGEKLPESTKRLVEGQTIEFIKKHKQFFPQFYLPPVKTKKSDDRK